MYLVQFMESFPDEASARELITDLRTHDGYQGGRLLPPCNQIDKNCWRVQVFFDGMGLQPSAAVPDGCRMVIVPRYLRYLLDEVPPLKLVGRAE